tara:strand:- start:222 stop:605 length:384 start_codon:yes stop_codon:yes gene_type:complete
VFTVTYKEKSLIVDMSETVGCVLNTGQYVSVDKVNINNLVTAVSIDEKRVTVNFLDPAGSVTKLLSQFKRKNSKLVLQFTDMNSQITVEFRLGHAVLATRLVYSKRLVACTAKLRKNVEEVADLPPF